MHIMLQPLQNRLHNVILVGCSLRGFATRNSDDLSEKKDWQKRKKVEKKRLDDKWKLEQSMNPFIRNKGAFHQLKNSGMNSDDPALALKFQSRNEDHFLTVESLLEESKAHRKQYKIDAEERKIIGKRKMIEKKMFPKPPNPVLLTWMEKETIRHLHQLDPVEWSPERLAESFPATPDIIKKVLSNRTFHRGVNVAKYDSMAMENWKLLSQGRLEIDEELKNHLASSSRKQLGLSTGQVQEMEQEILERLQSNVEELPRPQLPGPFGSIVANYKDKLAKGNEPEHNVKENIYETFEMSRIFGDNTIPGTPLSNEVSAYKDTALLATRIDLSKERKMDIDQFRRKYLKSTTGVDKNQKIKSNPYRDKYLQWLETEKKRSDKQTKDIKFLNTSDILDNITESTVGTNDVNDERAFNEPMKGVSESSSKEEVFVFDAQSGYKKPYVSPDHSDKIQIPRKLRHKSRLYKVDDCFYDCDGDFVYRVPGLK